MGDEGTHPWAQGYPPPTQLPGTERVFLVKSHPCNPTGVALDGDDLRSLLRKFTGDRRGALIDEAYGSSRQPPLSF